MISRRAILLQSLLLGTAPAIAQSAVLNPHEGEQTQAVQNAIDAATRNGGVVELSAGTFRVGRLIISGDLTLRGIPGRTVLRSVAGGRILDVVGSGHVNLEGISFQTKGLKDDLVRAEEVAHLVVDGCAFSGGGNGLHLIRCGGRITGNQFKFHQAGGLLSEDAVGLEVTSNTLSDIGNNGIQVWRSEKGEDGTLITNNRISRIAAEDGGDGPFGNGINIFRAGNVIVSNNRVTDCAFSGIRNNAGSNILITGNSISRTREVALYVEFAFQGAVVSNNVIEQVAHGISITNFDVDGRLAVCEGNIIRRIKGVNATGVSLGGGISAEADTVISNNIIEEADEYGIGLGYGSRTKNLTVTGNTILKCRRGVVFSAIGDGPFLVTDNIIDQAKSGALVGMEYEKVVTDDLALPGAKLPKSLTFTGNVIKN